MPTPDPTLLRVHISSRDFKRALDFIRKAREHVENTIEHEALLEGAVLRYARPFSPNEKAAKAKADSSLMIDIAAVLGEVTDFELHQRIIKLRNKVIAHSESEHYPMSTFPSFIGGPDDIRSLGFQSRSWHVVNERLDLDAFERITKAMHLKCLNMLVDATRMRA
jgi:hypothetical protein